jgi:hypothetical protein
LPEGTALPRLRTRWQKPAVAVLVLARRVTVEDNPRGAALAAFVMQTWTGFFVDIEDRTMQRTPTVTFHGLDHSETLEADIRTRIGALETYCGSIIGCRVIVELAQRHHQSGNHYHVRIDLSVPGEQIAVAHEASLHATAQATETGHATKDIEPDPERKHAFVAVREAFDVARRRLQDSARRARRSLKAEPEVHDGL